MKGSYNATFIASMVLLLLVGMISIGVVIHTQFSWVALLIYIASITIYVPVVYFRGVIKYNEERKKHDKLWENMQNTPLSTPSIYTDNETLRIVASFALFMYLGSSKLSIFAYAGTQVVNVILAVALSQSADTMYYTPPILEAPAIYIEQSPVEYTIHIAPPVIFLSEDEVIARVGENREEIERNFLGILLSSENDRRNSFANARGTGYWYEADRIYRDFKDIYDDPEVTWYIKISLVRTSLEYRVKLNDGEIIDPENLRLMANYCIDIADMFLKPFNRNVLAEYYLLRAERYALEALAMNVSMGGDNKHFLQTLSNIYYRLGINGIHLLGSKITISPENRVVYGEAWNALVQLQNSRALD